METLQNKSLTVTGKYRSKEWDSTFQLLAWWKADVVRNACVMVVGAGALGNEVLKNLALMNVGNILIVDFDHIEYSNLSRSVLFREKDCDGRRLKVDIAAERVREMNPNVRVMAVNGNVMSDVGLGIFRRVDVVIGCLDNRLARLFLNRACYKVGKTWIDGAIENLIGQVNVYKPEVSCYECGLTEVERNDIRIQASLPCGVVNSHNITYGRIPTTPISSSIVAAIQVQEALKVIHGYDKKLMSRESFYYEGMNNLVLQLKNEPLQDECFSHYAYEPLLESPLGAGRTVGETLQWLAAELGDPDAAILLDHDLVMQVVTRQSNLSFDVVQPQSRMTEDFLNGFRRVEEEDVYSSRTISEIDASFPYPDLTLGDIGIPPLHIVRVASGGELYHVELTADNHIFQFS